VTWIGLSHVEEIGSTDTHKIMSSTLQTIVAAIDQLTLTEQLVLMERLASRIRSHTLRTPVVSESDLAAMANDPAIQRELRQVEDEFSVEEADGLDRG
jgi:hypothetical protein